MKIYKKILSGEKGGSAVEFAIILPILIMLIFGIIQFGIAYNKYVSVAHAVREGARLAAVGLYEDPGFDFEQAVRDSAPTIDTFFSGLIAAAMFRKTGKHQVKAEAGRASKSVKVLMKKFNTGLNNRTISFSMVVHSSTRWDRVVVPSPWSGKVRSAVRNNLRLW